MIPITEETNLANARRWLNIIRFRESGTIIQLQDDCEFRVLQIIQNPRILRNILGPYYRKYLMKYIPVDRNDMNQCIKEALIEACLERKIYEKSVLVSHSSLEILNKIASKGYEVGFFISHITSLIKKDNFQPFYDLELLVSVSKNLSVIVFSEHDITHQKYEELVDKACFLYDHIIKYPMYEEKDARQFISYYSHQWNYHLSEKVTREIIRMCGGYLWLIHQAHRNLRDNSSLTVKEALENNMTLRKLETIWTVKFTNKERDILRKVHFGNITQEDTLSHEYEFLLSMKLIKEINNKTLLSIPLFSLVIERENRLSKLILKDNLILIGEKDITYELSRKERSFMKLLLSSKKKIISRDVVAQAIWGKEWEEKYSDWAIDRLAFRLRLKLAKIGIDEKLLKTVKKKGFLFG